MSNTDTVKAGMAAWCSADWATLESMLTDDFLFGDPAQPLDKNGFLGFGRTMLTAFPDWSFNASGFRENGDSVYYTAHITGTHTGALSGIPDLPTVPATGRHIDLPAEEHAYTLRDGRLSRIVITAPPEGGFTAMFAQLGVPLG